MKLTIKAKLLPSSQQHQQLLQTMKQFNIACNHISKLAFENKTFGQVGIHKLSYHLVRDTYRLPSQLVIRAIGKVAESYKINRSIQHEFKEHSAVVYDSRILTFKGLDTVSIQSLDGRLKMPLVIGQYGKVEGRKVRGQADLTFVDGKFFLCLVVEFPDPHLVDTNGFLGVDMGIVNIATTSDGQNWSGEQIEEVRNRISAHRSRLQSRGTKSAKRRLKKMSQRQRRFVKNTNHCVSKRIVEQAKALGLGVAVEKLRRLKPDEKTVKCSRKERHRRLQWSFFELRSFLEYKCRLAGIPFVMVDPAYTSQTCSVCGHCSENNRKSQSEFVCVQCGVSLNADFNASVNISRAAINQPIVATAA